MIDQVKAAAPVDAVKAIQNKLVIVPVPLGNVVVERSSLLGRVSSLVENLISEERLNVWWRGVFTEAIQDKAFSNQTLTDARFNLYQACHVEDQTAGQSNLSIAVEADGAPLEDRYQNSFFYHGTPLEGDTHFSVEVFRSLLGLSSETDPKTAFDMAQYIHVFLEKDQTLSAQERAKLKASAMRFRKAAEIERRFSKIIASGLRSETLYRSEQQVLSLGQEIQESVAALKKEHQYIFRLGCGSGNPMIRHLLYAAFKQVQETIVDKDLIALEDELEKVVEKGQKELLARFNNQDVRAFLKGEEAHLSDATKVAISDWLLDEFLPTVFDSLQEKLRISCKGLHSSQTPEERIEAYQMAKNWMNGDVKELKAYLRKAVLADSERTYGYIVRNGALDQFFDLRGDDIVRKVKAVSNGYFPDSFQKAIQTFIETGTLDGVPEHLQSFAQHHLIKTFAKTCYEKLREITQDQLFPGEESREIIQGFFKVLDDSTEDALETAFRVTFREVIQDKVINKTLNKGNRLAQEVYNYLPDELKESLKDVGVDVPENPIWYLVKRDDNDKKTTLKVFWIPEKGKPCQEMHFTTEHPKLVFTRDFFCQLIRFRKDPRIEDAASFTYGDVQTYLEKAFGKKGVLQPETALDHTNPFQNFAREQQLLYHLMKDQSGLDVPAKALFEIRKQALIDMWHHCQNNPRKHHFLIEGVESFVKEAIEQNPSKKEDLRALGEAFEASWHASANEPDLTRDESKSSANILISEDIKRKIAAVLVGFGVSKENYHVLRRIIQAAFGADMGPVIDAFLIELGFGELDNVDESEVVDIGKKVGETDPFLSFHEVFVAQIDDQIKKTQSIAWSFALKIAKHVLWAVKEFLRTVIPVVIEYTPDFIKQLTHKIFLYLMSVLLPLAAKGIVWMFLRSDTVESYRKKAFELQRWFTRTGGFDFEVERDEEGNPSHHLQLFEWFRPAEDLKYTVESDQITHFEFASLNLKFEVKDGRAFVDETERKDAAKAVKYDGFYIAYDQRLPKGMRPFCKYLILENERDSEEKMVFLAEDSLTATTAAHSMKALTKQTASPWMSRISQEWADMVFPKNDPEATVFSFRYNGEEGHLVSDDSCSMAYLLFFYLTQGETALAEQAFNTLETIAKNNNQTLSASLDPLLRRINIFCMLQSNRELYYLGLRAAALREQVKIQGREDKAEILAPKLDEVLWKWLDVFSLQYSMLRYQKSRYRMLTPPLTYKDEYEILKGIERRIKELRELVIEDKDFDQLLEKMDMSTYALWGFTPHFIKEKVRERIQHGKDTVISQYHQHENLIDRALMPKELKARYQELRVRFTSEKTPPSSADSAAENWKEAVSFLPGMLVKNYAHPITGSTNKYACNLPFESEDGELGFTSEFNRVFFGIDPLKTLHTSAFNLSDQYTSLESLSIAKLRAHFFAYYRMARNSDRRFELMDALDRIPGSDPLKTLLKTVAASEEDSFPKADSLRQSCLYSYVRFGEKAGIIKYFNEDIPFDKLQVKKSPELKEKLKTHFFSYYALARGDGPEELAREFQKTLLDLDWIDHTVYFLRDVAEKGPNYFPKAEFLKAHLAEAAKSSKPFEAQIKEIHKAHFANKHEKEAYLPLKAIDITAHHLHAHFCDYYELAYGGSTLFEDVICHSDPMTNFLLEVLKTVAKNNSGFVNPEKLREAMLQSVEGDSTDLKTTLKELKKACQGSEKFSVIHRQEVPSLQALVWELPWRQKLSLAANACRGLYAYAKGDKEKMAKEAAEAGVALSSQFFNASLPKEAITRNVQSMAKSALSASPRSEKPKEVDSPLVCDQVMEFDGYEQEMKRKLKAADQAISKGMQALFNNYISKASGSCKFKSEQSYFQLRKRLEDQKKAFKEQMGKELDKICSYANHEPLSTSSSPNHRLTLVTKKELLTLFVKGDLEMMGLRTGLNMDKLAKLNTMLLTYHQLQNQRSFIEKKLDQLAGIDIKKYRFQESELTLSRPFNWDSVTINELRQYFIYLGIYDFDELEKASLGQAEALFESDFFHLCHQYPDIAQKGWSPSSIDCLHNAMRSHKSTM